MIKRILVSCFILSAIINAAFIMTNMSNKVVIHSYSVSVVTEVPSTPTCVLNIDNYCLNPVDQATGKAVAFDNLDSEAIVRALQSVELTKRCPGSITAYQAGKIQVSKRQ